jgi:hypothetical protein
MPLDLVERIETIRRDGGGLSYSDVVIAALRKQFALPAPIDRIDFQKGAIE